MHGRGDIAEAEVANREALAIWRALGNTAEQGWTLFALGQEARLRGDYSAARDLLEQSVAVSQAAGVLQAETNSLCRLGDVSLDLEDDIEAERRARSALARASAAGWTPGVVIALRILGEISMLRRDCESAARQFEASLASARELGNRLLSAQALVCLGQAAIEQGDHGRARQHLAEALELARMVEDHAATARGLEVFGALAIGAGRVGDGVGLVGAASALRAAGGGRISPREQRWLKGYLAKARAVLGEAGVERAFQAGVLLSPTRAIDCALELRLENSRPVQAAAEKLTTRERETAMLVARGLSNRQIAEQLVIGERTVQTHVGNILGKLGLTSRAQIAVWVTEHKLQSKNP